MLNQFVDSVFQRARLKLTLKRNGNQDHLVIMAWFIFGHCSLHPLPHYFPTFSTVSTVCITGGADGQDSQILSRQTLQISLRILGRKPRPVHALLGGGDHLVTTQCKYTEHFHSWQLDYMLLSMH